MRVHSVTHYPDTNTLEAAWVEDELDDNGEVISINRVKCQSYSPVQRLDFITDTGLPEYADLAGWL
jgi:hypothetical protein